MKPERTELSAGIFFTKMPVDAFKVSRLTVYLSLPLTDASAASKLALLPYVLRRATATYTTTAALSRRLEELYSADLASGVLKSGDNQVLALSMGMLRPDFVPEGEDPLFPATALLHEVLFSPFIDKTTGVFSEEYVEREKKNASDRIRAIQNAKASYARMRCLATMCANEPYGISELGTVEEMEKITPASLFDAYRTLLAEAHVEIYYTGTEDVSAIVESFRAAFAALHRHPRPLPQTTILRRAKKRTALVERAAATQGNLCIGFRSGVALGEADAAAFMLFHVIFAASPTSKLFANVRERLSLCYSCSSRLQLSKGLFLVSAGIENKKRRKAVREIFHQLSRTRAGKITEREMTMAKETLLNQIRTIYDEPVALERWYFNRTLAGVTESPEDLASAIEGLAVRDVVRIAKGVTADTVYFLRGTLEATQEEGESDE